jgi:hypothetical protein
MSRKQSSLKSFEIRKQVLIAEAEMLRDRRGEDLDVIQQGFKAMRTQARSIASVASIAAIVVAGVSALWRARKKGVNGKPWLISKLFTGARAAASTACLASRSRQR